MPLPSCASPVAPAGWLCHFPCSVLPLRWAQPVLGQGLQGRDLLEEMALLSPWAALQGLAAFLG